jgi:hypothetical protein
MNPAREVPFPELASLADRLFLESDDDEEKLAAALEGVPPEGRRQLLVSDLLNAYQVFYYFFRERPDEGMEERLMLESASVLSRGILVDEVDLLEIVFRVDGDEPVIEISDGKQVLFSFRGKNAFREAARFTEGTS